MAETSKRILIVDDERHQCETLASLLRNAGFTIMTETSGIGAIRKVGLETPDLVLLDLNMPGIDGHEVCRRIKADDRTRHVPVIAVTANEERGLIGQLYAEGFTAYVPKPYRGESVIATVVSVLAAAGKVGPAQRQDAENVTIR